MAFSHWKLRRIFFAAPVHNVLAPVGEGAAYRQVM
jgi:hypothetical protein